MSPRPDVSEARKDQILDAASEVFADKGVHASRMDDIVEKTGLSKGALYWYFKSKDDILIGIFERMFQRGYEELGNLKDVDSLASERLLYITEWVIEYFNRMLRLMPLAYEFMAWAFRRKFVQDAFKLYVNKYMDILVPLIQQGIDAGEFRQVDPLDVAISTGAIFEGTILIWVYDHQLVKPDEHIRKGIQLLLRGIQA